MRRREKDGLPLELREWPEPGDPGLRAFYEARLAWAEEHAESVALVLIEYRRRKLLSQSPLDAA